MKWLSSSQALAVLGCRRQTLYANVSRGRIRVKPDPADARRSLYHGADVQGLADRQAGRRPVAAVAAQAIDWGDPVLASSISTVRGDRLWYRGRDAIELAREATLEQTAALLWQTTAVTFRSPHARGEPACASPMRAAMSRLAARAAEDPPLPGLSREALTALSMELVGDMAQAMLGGGAGADPLHRRIAKAWRAEAAEPLLRRALVLLAEHELNASTFAVRVAASTGASPAACLLAGLCTLAGPLHGGAAAQLRLLLRMAARVGAAKAVERWLERRRPPAAFGHPLYPDGDPRAASLLAAFEPKACHAELAAVMLERTGEKPNIDFALAALGDSLGLPACAPLVLFAIARSIGWLAHAMEQAAEGALIRPRARYIGPPLDGADPRAPAQGRPAARP